VNVDRVAELLAHHRRTFDVPTGPARSPGGGETRLAGLGPFPESEIKRVMLAPFLGRRGASAGSFLLFAEITARELAITRLFHHRKIDITIGGIGGSFVLQFRDQITNAIKATRSPGHGIGAQNIERIHILKIGADIALTHLLHRQALFGSAVEDLVVDVGEVLHKLHHIGTIALTGPAEIAAQHIPDDVAAGMAEMTEIVDGDAAAINGDTPVIQGFEHLFAAAESVGES